jgi:uncharacterized protein
MKKRSAAAVVLLAAAGARADNVAQPLPFTQAWTNGGLITVSDDWSGVPGVIGYRGDDLTTVTGTDPQTIVADGTTTPVDVNQNRSDPNVFATGGVTEFDGIANPVVALQGSGTADTPFLLLHLNTTGASNVTVSYNLRDIDGSADNAVQPVALQYRVGSSGTFTNVAAGFVADATTGPSLATLVTPVSVVLPALADNQPQVQVRIITTNAVGNDEWVGIDDIEVTTGSLTLSVSDVAVDEGQSGTTTATFTVSLSAPAPPGGVSFDVTTQDDTATLADNDYVALSLPGRTIPEAGTTATFAVTVNGDAAIESDERFFLNVTNVTGVTVADGQGEGTITNDDFVITPIHTIQGPGTASTLLGNIVTTVGIVTGVKSNGFFVQTPDGAVDGDPDTSEGILVFMAGTPPPAAAVGNEVRVTGTVAEFVPSQDPASPPLTEIGFATVAVLSTANALPAAVPLTAADTDPAGDIEQLERFEGMRVSVASLTVIGPTLGSVNEPTATATSSGVFHGVVTGIARPFREHGVQVPDPLPAGAPCCVPRFDGNPERLRVDSDGQTGAAVLDVSAGTVVTGLVGPLDYGFRTYTILPDPGAPLTVTGGAIPTAAPLPRASEFTVASFNVQRLFDTADDAGTSEPVLSTAAFDARLAKASLAVRDYLHAPDILGLSEVENLSTLQALALRINSDALTAGEPSPAYDAYLVEGNDVGGIDVGFLVKTAAVAALTPRVTVNAVVQEGASATYLNPNTGAFELLHDRPPLRLDAVVHASGGGNFPVTVIVNHLRSLNGVSSEEPSGTGTEGARVRAKRAAQAEFLADLVQGRQVASPGERIVLVGDFNAFEFNDGYVDSMGTIVGAPTSPDEVVVASADLVNPDLANLAAAEPAEERYSYVFDGNAQSLDHVVVNQALVAATYDRRLRHPRTDADFPETARNDGATPTRLSDHDALVAYFDADALAGTDLIFRDGFQAGP